MWQTGDKIGQHLSEHGWDVTNWGQKLDKICHNYIRCDKLGTKIGQHLSEHT